MIDALKDNENLWDFYTKKEEYDPPILDRYQRFPFYLSRHRDVLEPRVSDFLMQDGLKVEYPDAKAFAICLTHDIDVLRLSTSTAVYEAARSLRRGRLLKSSRTLLNQLSKRSNSLWNFEKIMSLERKYEAKSSFYFMALEKHEQDFNYRIEDLRNGLKNIIDNGWEVGLHGGYEAYNDLDKLKRGKKRLENVIEKQVAGYRSHYLRFRVPMTWTLLRKAGFEYDTTFGYADCVGFRNGMCHPFKPFDLNTNQFVDILEIPLTIMDSTLSEYMRLDLESAWEVTKWLIQTVEKRQGVLTILWHNTSMTDVMFEFYEEILKYCQKRNAWMTSGEEIWRWWSKNDFMQAKEAG
ncbi:MAG: polysaccharide deacetylase family protein [Candidatus Zixiibacteriota bacterium]